MKKTFLLATTFSSLHVLGNIYPNQYFTHALILSSIQSYTRYYNTTEWVHFWVSIIWYWISLTISFGKNRVIIIYYCYSNFHVNLINNLPTSLLAFFANIFGEKWSNQNKQLISRTFSARLCSIILDYNSEYYQLKWTELHVCHINEKFAILSLHLIIIIIIQFM